jgi:hypothetical protein
MGLGKTYSTKYLVDSNGNTGAANQVLVSTATGVDWVDGSGSGIIGGPYLPLAGGALSGTGRVLTVTSTNDQVVASIKCSASGVPSTLGFQGDGSTSDYHVRVGANTTNFVAYTNNIERMRIASGGNVGIGVTSLTSAKLEVSDSATQAGILITSDGGNEQFKIRRYSNNNEQLILGFHSSDYAQIQAVEQGVAYRPLALNPNGGNVGIGTTNPASNLHLHSASSATVMKISNSSSGVGAFDGMAIALGNGFSQLWYYENGYFRIATNNSERMRITSTGDVGIGTTSPGAQLHLLQPTLFNTTDLFRIQHNEQVWGSTVTVTDFVVKSTGNVGIGTTSPGYKLTVNGTLRSSNLTIADNIIHEGDTNTYMAFPLIDTISWNTNGSERMRINSSGNVGIGTTSPGYRLHVAGSMGMDTYLFHAGNNDTFIGFAATDEFSVNAGGVKQLNVTSNNVNITDTLSYTYPTATNQYNGEIVTFGSFNTANGAIAAGDVIVYTTAGVNSGWMRAQGNITYSKGMLGIAMGTSASDGILIKGFARNAAFASGGLGSPLYLSPTSAGDTTNVIPSSTNNVVRIVGYMLNPTNDEIFFDPDKSWVAV